MASVTELDMFIGGAWRPSATGETSSASSPATGETIGAVPLGDRDDARAAIAAAGEAADALGPAHRVRARRQDARGRRHHRVPARGAGPHPHPRPGQAAARRGLRRGRRAGRVLAHGRRRCQAPRRRAAQLVLARQAGDAGAARPRRRRGDQPVELALHDARGAGGARARLRQRGGVDPGAVDLGVRRRAGPLHRRRRPAPRRVQPRHRARPGGGRRDRAPPRRRRRRPSSAPPPPGARWPPPRRARRRCWRWAATARSCCSTTATSTPPSRRRWWPASCAPARAARRASASSCTAPSTTSTSRSWPAPSPSRSCSATRSPTRRRWDR